MTATERLRAMLDERGVEWTEPNNKARSHTTYWTAGALRCIAVEFNDGMVSIASTSDDLTPEQAIEATLGGVPYSKPAMLSDLQAENEKLREQGERLFDKTLELGTENDKLREQMERLVTLLRVDCDIDASWDGLRRFWSIELTESGCLMRDRACKAEAENAKLRELVRDMWENGMCECDERGACAECEYHFPEHMRELGVKV